MTTNKVLVVDDDRCIRWMLAETLMKEWAISRCKLHRLKRIEGTPTADQNERGQPPS